MVIDVTDSAVAELKKVLETKNSTKPLRIYVAGYGWGGPTFGIALDEHKEGDIKTVVEDLTFLLEGDLGDTFSKFTVDYSDSWLRKGFSVTPDGLSGSC